ncbi:MAG: hypothetical protein K6C14_00070 [Eubacterium sp.]|nr:hypothetical protein [Eubacterium sp.]
MALRVIDGDYKRDAQTGKALTVQYIEELLQNAFTALNTRRGRFYPNKSFGSRIKELNREPADKYAFIYAAEALDGLDGVTVKSAELENGRAVISLLINDTEGQVSIRLENNV